MKRISKPALFGPTAYVWSVALKAACKSAPPIPRSFWRTGLGEKHLSFLFDSDAQPGFGNYSEIALSRAYSLFRMQTPEWSGAEGGKSYLSVLLLKKQAENTIFPFIKGIFHSRCLLKISLPIPARTCTFISWILSLRHSFFYFALKATGGKLNRIWLANSLEHRHIFPSIFHSLLAEEARTVKLHSTGQSYIFPPKQTQMMASSTILRWPWWYSSSFSCHSLAWSEEKMFS